MATVLHTPTSANPTNGAKGRRTATYRHTYTYVLVIMLYLCDEGGGGDGGGVGATMKAAEATTSIIKM